MSRPVTVITGHGQMAAVTLINQAVHGRPGRDGQDAPGAAWSRPAGQPLPALCVVWEDAAGRVWPLSASDGAHIDQLAGLSLTAAGNAGDELRLTRAGVVNAAGLGLSPGRVWLGEQGRLTQTPPASGFDVLVGYALSGQRLALAFMPAIALG